MTHYGVYSKKQFEVVNHDNKHKYPYVYYKVVKTNKIVMITEVFHDANKKSLFDDAVYYGEVEYYGAFKEPQVFS